MRRLIYDMYYNEEISVDIAIKAVEDVLKDLHLSNYAVKVEVKD